MEAGWKSLRTFAARVQPLATPCAVGANFGAYVAKVSRPSRSSQMGECICTNALEVWRYLSDASANK